ncbi:MAG: M6 family metalloprotease domain-containing protein, partial [Planctomycetales bacterium]|nr:M6 family metalloprotease domain-containing protein [Planctomycetales bacterium]
MSDAFAHDYEFGPTTCCPTPKVIKSIKQQIRANHALSRGDIRLATAMGLVASDSVRPLGFNDGLVYPVEAGPQLMSATRGRSPMSALSASTAKRKMHALALLVDFSDNRGHRPAAEFQKLLFDSSNPNSMASYYQEMSRGSLSVDGEVVGYIRAPKPYSYYTNGQSGTGGAFPRNTPGLLTDALKKFCKTDNLKRFDTDGDGFVDGIFLIHAGGGAEAEPDPNKRRDMIWSHKWVLPTPFINSGVQVFAYSTEPEDGRVGVFAHEFGHVLGLPDLYDSTYRSRGIGDWCLMAGGSWGGGGDQPCRMSAWCLSELGWLKPTNVKSARTLKLDTLEKSAKGAYRLWTKGKSGPEYFLIENRQQVGRDISLPGSGLAVWHIDESQSGNTNPLSYRVALVQADGKRDLEFDRNGGDAG